jgi:23S rRNA pseudouridine1911/1915/1917 synthase
MLFSNFYNQKKTTKPTLPTLQLIHEDDNLIVIDKPSGLIVNRSVTAKDITLQDIMCEYFSQAKIGQKNAEIDTFSERCGIVHRLDKDTSGLLLIAKNEETFTYLQEKFKKREVQKEYIAVGFGEFKDERVRVAAPLARDPKNRTKFIVSKKGRESFTVVEKVKNIPIDEGWLCYVKVWPLTGRTHQIRVHMTALNHPIVGDKIYSSKNQLKRAAELGSTRMMLHAHKITFDEKTFTSEIPDELNNIVKMNEEI